MCFLKSVDIWLAHIQCFCCTVGLTLSFLGVVDLFSHCEMKLEYSVAIHHYTRMMARRDRENKKDRGR